MHSSPDVSSEHHKKLLIKELYNEQRCGVDIVNEMIKYHSSKPISKSWTLFVFSFILDLCAVNAHTILKFNLQSATLLRRNFFGKT